MPRYHHRHHQLRKRWNFIENVTRLSKQTVMSVTTACRLEALTFRCKGCHFPWATVSNGDHRQIIYRPHTYSRHVTHACNSQRLQCKPPRKPSTSTLLMTGLALGQPQCREFSADDWLVWWPLNLATTGDVLTCASARVARICESTVVCQSLCRKVCLFRRKVCWAG